MLPTTRGDKPHHAGVQSIFAAYMAMIAYRRLRSRRLLRRCSRCGRLRPSVAAERRLRSAMVAAVRAMLAVPSRSEIAMLQRGILSIPRSESVQKVCRNRKCTKHCSCELIFACRAQ